MTLNKTFFTQHLMTLNYLHKRAAPLGDFKFDTPLPYIQNGIGIKFAKGVDGIFFINNYLGSLPTWSNTWASIWLTIAML